MKFEEQINILRDYNYPEGKGLYPEMYWNVLAAG